MTNKMIKVMKSFDFHNDDLYINLIFTFDGQLMLRYKFNTSEINAIDSNMWFKLLNENCCFNLTDYYSSPIGKASFKRENEISIFILIIIILLI